MSTAAVSGKRKRRRLSPSEKYEIFVSVLTGQGTQREWSLTYRLVDQAGLLLIDHTELLADKPCI